MRTTILFAILSLFLVACGDSSNEGSSGAASSPAEQAAPENPVTSENGVTVVRMTGNDRMKFNLEAFTVTAGSPIKLIFENVGKMPKAAMGHNVVFLVADADPNAFAAAAASARDNDYIPVGLQDQILATTALLGPGETDTIEFNAPAEPGEYVYLCSFPAHLFAGMRGVMTVVE